MASQLYDAFNDQLEKEVPVKRGIFGADMAIELINDGPVTILLDTKIHRKTCSRIRLHVFNIELLGDHLVDRNFFVHGWLRIEACVVIISLKRDSIPNLGDGSGLRILTIHRCHGPFAEYRDQVDRFAETVLVGFDKPFAFLWNCPTVRGRS